MIRRTILEVRPQAMNEARPQVSDKTWKETASAFTLHLVVTRAGGWTRTSLLNWTRTSLLNWTRGNW